MALGIVFDAVIRAEEEEREIWVKHYCSSHKILLVGEGDFSFSLSLANSFGSASNIVASSLDSYAELIKKYKQANSNLVKLVNLGADVLHGLDATKMKLHTDLKMRKFDRIIFNFPHAGFHRKEDDKFLIKMHRDVVHGFLRNARGMLQANGEIHVNHKTTFPYNQWNLEELASQNSLALVDCVGFRAEDYPGYNNKSAKVRIVTIPFVWELAVPINSDSRLTPRKCQKFHRVWIQLASHFRTLCRLRLKRYDSQLQPYHSQLFLTSSDSLKQILLHTRTTFRGMSCHNRQSVSEMNAPGSSKGTSVTLRKHLEEMIVKVMCMILFIEL